MAETGAAELLVRRYLEELFDQPDSDVYDEILATDYVEHAPAPFSDVEPGRVDGPSATRATVHWLLAQFPDLRFTVEACVTEADLVAVLVMGQGTNLGAIGTIPPTGRAFSSRSTHWFRIRDGRLAEHWATRDDLTSMLQLGVIDRQ